MQCKCRSCASAQAAALFARKHPDRAILKDAKAAAISAGRKFCFGCKHAYDKAAFNLNATTNDGLQVYCRDCMAVAVEASYVKTVDFHRERRREKRRIYYQANKHRIDRSAERNRWQAWAAVNKAHVRRYSSTWQRTTRSGWLASALQGMRQRSKRRGFPPPCFASTSELAAWLAGTAFTELWTAYSETNFNSALRPSIDRIDNSKPYQLDNIRLVTWRENLEAWNGSEAAKKKGGRLILRARQALKGDAE